MLGRSLFRLALFAGRRERCTAAAPAEVCPFTLTRKEVDASPSSLKPYKAIPTARRLPLLGTTLDILKFGGAAKMHEYIDMRHKQLGPIFREKLGPVEAVVLSSQSLINEVNEHIETCPMHLVPEPWLIYNRKKGIKRGLFFMDGIEWKEKRTILNNSLLGNKEVEKHGEAVKKIVDDLIMRWDTLARDNGGTVPNLETELYNWSVETLGTIVFGRRLGCVAQPGESSEMNNFVYYVQKIFAESAKMSLFSPKLAATLRLPVWKRFEEAADNALQIARDCTEQRIKELQSEKNLGEHGVIGSLLANPSITKEEIVNIVADLIIAAADTTSHATQWALYSLAKNPECQEKLLNQINEMKEAEPEEIKCIEKYSKKMKYARWVIKETLRLYPIAPFLTRIFRSDISAGGYEIPAKTLVLMSQYTIGRNPESFANADEFRPERWNRPEGRVGRQINLAQGCMPFGHGARACIGKRVAEMKMTLLMSKAVQDYKLEAQNDVGIALRMITTPDKPIEIRFHKRGVKEL